MVLAYFGPVDEGEDVFRPLREHPGLAVDLVQPMPYTALQQLLDPMCPPGQCQYWKSENLPALGDEAIDVFLGQAAEATSPSTQLVLEAKVGGACRRVEEEATPLSRSGAYTLGAFAVLDDPAETELHVGWARDTWNAIEPFSMPGVVLNYTSDTGEERVRSTFGLERYGRLVEVKDRWDPDNVFRSNQNIQPSQTTASAPGSVTGARQANRSHT